MFYNSQSFIVIHSSLNDVKGLLTLIFIAKSVKFDTLTILLYLLFTINFKKFVILFLLLLHSNSNYGQYFGDHYLMSHILSDKYLLFIDNI